MPVVQPLPVRRMAGALAAPGYSRSNTSRKRKRGSGNQLPSLALRAKVAPGRLLWLFTGITLIGGCASLWKRPFHLPVEFTVLRGQLVVHSDFPIAANHRLLEELAARRNDLQERLHLPPSDEPVHIYLFASPDEFREFVRLRHPSFPMRRAFFLETDTQLQI